jgi:hypothetical protein
MKLTNESINDKLLRVVDAQKDLERTIESVQATCEHNNVAECEYKSSEFFNALPPMRVCLDCGLSEEGWGCGFRILREKIAGLQPRRISREDLYSIRCGKYITQ